MNIPERLNPLLTPPTINAADEAACKLDGMFRDIFNREERLLRRMNSDNASFVPSNKREAT